MSNLNLYASVTVRLGAISSTDSVTVRVASAYGCSIFLKLNWFVMPSK